MGRTIMPAISAAPTSLSSAMLACRRNERMSSKSGCRPSGLAALSQPLWTMLGSNCSASESPGVCAVASICATTNIQCMQASSSVAGSDTAGALIAYCVSLSFNIVVTDRVCVVISHVPPEMILLMCDRVRKFSPPKRRGSQVKDRVARVGGPHDASRLSQEELEEPGGEPYGRAHS